MSQAESKKTDRSKKAWNFTPPLPVTVSPYFRWPPDFAGVLKWMLSGWFPESERSIILVLAIAVSLIFEPSLSQTNELAPGWVAHLLI